MGNNPYKDGQKSYRNGYWVNPYRDEHRRAEWQRGFEESEAAANGEQEAKNERRNSLWNVPERAKAEYIDMEDSFSPETVLGFMLAMYPEEVQPALPLESDTSLPSTPVDGGA